MARRKRLKHEWHLYSITSFYLAVAIILSTLYYSKPTLLAIGTMILTVITAPFFASDNWKIVPVRGHKALVAFSISGVIFWLITLLTINKFLPTIFNDNSDE